MLYAVIGYPIKKTVSPAMHNAAFKHHGIDGQYISMPIKPKDLGPVIKNLIRFGFKGVNITIPYKEKTMEYLDSISKTALKIKAINTIVINKGRLHGENTDIYGFYQSIVHCRIAIKDKKVLLIGAGGAGRAAASVLVRLRPVDFLITDISNAQAKKSCICFNAKLINYHQLSLLNGKCDVIINATPCDQQDPAGNLLKPNGLYYDLNYTYSRRLKKNMRYINGLEMLVQQGARSFEIWTKKRAPISIMRKAVMENV